MNTTKMNATIGFATVIVAGILLFFQEDANFRLSDVSSAWIAGFVFISIILGMIVWRTNTQNQSVSKPRQGRTKKR